MGDSRSSMARLCSNKSRVRKEKTEILNDCEASGRPGRSQHAIEAWSSGSANYIKRLRQERASRSVCLVPYAKNNVW